MDAQLRVSEEQRSVPGDAHGALPAIALEPYGFEQLVPAFAAAYWEYWLEVNGSDLLREWVDVEVAGVTIPTPRLEAELDRIRLSGRRVQVARVSDEILGFLIYDEMDRDTLFIHSLFVKPEAQSLSLGKGLVESAKPGIRRALFKTSIPRPPARLLQILRGPTEIGRDDHFIHWELKRWP